MNNLGVMHQSQILSSHKISSLQYTLSIILHAENSLLVYLPALLINVLVGQNDDEPRKQQNGNSSLEGYTRGASTREVIYITHKMGHPKHVCRKLHNWNQRAQFAHIASTNETSNQSIMISIYEFEEFQLYQESQKYSSTHITTILDLSKLNTYLVSSSSKWIIESGVIGETNNS